MNYHQRIALLVLAMVLVGGIIWHYTRAPGARNVLLTDATAAPVSGSNDAVRVFLKLSNLGPPQRILSASSNDAGSAKLTNVEGHASLVVPGQSSVSLAADGAHVVLEGVAGDLQDGRLQEGYSPDRELPHQTPAQSMRKWR